jgi:hypothetical protein
MGANRWRKNSQPSKAMLKGLTSQLTNSVTPMPRKCWRNSRKAAKSTFMSMGTIITQISRPTGRLTCATSRRASASNAPGCHCPSAMPTAMHTSTQSVR